MLSARKEHLKSVIAELPDQPGVYRYYDADNEVIYVGKAKSLIKRVSSYFNKLSALDRKTAQLVSQIHRIEYTVVNTEFDALLLENSLIKQFQPRYNINLKDDKSFPFICVTHEPFPRVYPTRRMTKGEGTYYGPFASVKAMNTVLELVKKLYHIRSCTLPLAEKSIAAGKFKLCLEYHLGNCLGPCEAKQSAESYNQEIQEAIGVIKGNLGVAKSWFHNQMMLHAENLEFEKAQALKERLDLLENYQTKSILVNPNLDDMDIITFSSEEKAVYVNYMQVAYGSVVQSYNLEIKRKLGESDSEIAAMAAVHLRETFQSKAKEILSNLAFDFAQPGVSLSLPQIGDKRKLVELSLKNALFFKRDVTLKASETPAETRSDRILKKLQYDLKLKTLPHQIECFDNSNIQGTSPVAGMVCFRDGKPYKKEYRHFHIKTVDGPNDFASMEEVVYRRYRRQLDEGNPLPDLIIVDGGKGQLSSACEALQKLGLYGQIPIIGIAKRLEEIYYPDDSVPLHLDKKGESVRLIQRIRDEVHRFAITFHRATRSKNNLKVDLLEIPGFGSKTLERLQRHFKSLKKIGPEHRDELVTLIGAKRTELLLDYLAGKPENPVS